MYALIEKETNAILRVSPVYTELSDEKPFVWIECPNNTAGGWTYDGVEFHPPYVPEPVIAE